MVHQRDPMPSVPRVRELNNGHKKREWILRGSQGRSIASLIPHPMKLGAVMFIRHLHSPFDCPHPPLTLFHLVSNGRHSRLMNGEFHKNKNA